MTCAAGVALDVDIGDLAVINKILTHLDAKVAAAELRRLPETRAPLQARLFN